jgi:hypothetical protein
MPVRDAQGKEYVKATYFVLSNKIIDWFFRLNNSSGLNDTVKRYACRIFHVPQKNPVEP